jgi:hypothetical protein
MFLVGLLWHCYKFYLQIFIFFIPVWNCFGCVQFINQRNLVWVLCHSRHLDSKLIVPFLVIMTWESFRQTGDLKELFCDSSRETLQVALTNSSKPMKILEMIIYCSAVLCVGQCSLLHSQHNYWYRYTTIHMYYMFQPKSPSSGTRALTISLFLPPAVPPCTGRCLHIGSVLDGCIVLVMPVYYINM